MKNIVVLTDFSKHADNALKAAAVIAQKMNGQIHLIHTVPLISAAFGIASKTDVEMTIEQQYTEHVKATAQDHIKKQVEAFALPNIPIKAHVFTGDLFKVVEKFVVENQVDLVVMGTKGTSGLDEMLIGSNTEKIVRHATVPVLSLIAEVENFLPKKIVFASLLLDQHAAVVKKLMPLLEAFEAHLELLFVNTPSTFLTNKEIEERAYKLVKATDLHNFSLRIYAAISEDVGIRNYADEIDADLVVMATNQRKGLARYFLGSLSEEIINHYKRPVLTFSLRQV
ncbi:MAG TPA: hypothetical protein DCM08_06970 [Microscillaceae bacterium]|jgi:nucleotide-binding universal stress UspA family protein|nr:hypothetical protein [Microscillaceae bacterium]